MRIKPHIKRVKGCWDVSIDGDVVYCCVTFADAIYAAHHVWRFQ